MEEYRLDIVGQSAELKTSPTGSKDTGIFFPQDLVEFIGRESEFEFHIHKIDFLQAIVNILDSLPLYSNKRGNKITHDDLKSECEQFFLMINKFFGPNETAVYRGKPFSLSETTGGRRYLYGLEEGLFSIRKFLVANYSTLLFQKDDDNTINLRLETRNTKGFASTNIPVSSLPIINESIGVNSFITFISAIRTKPFLLLAGISGSGKSRIVRELARACWPLDSDERKANKPENYELIQVKPNWHDSSELIGYVSHIDGEKYVYGKFLPFVAKAWANRDKPYFLCLDEMNLAPVEQYFAEYLSVIETRKLVDGVIVTDPILESPKKKGDKSEELMRIPDLNGNGGWFDNFILELTYDNQELHDKFLNEGIALPPNLVVVGTVNMDETTFTFSRKVLDRAMTIEMNDVDLRGGLTESQEDSMVLDANQVIGDAAEGKDVYADNKAVCDKVIEYLETINAELEGTPFKIGYRARNEFLLYALNRILLTQTDGSEEAQTSVLNKALDEMTSMKILSRIEGEDQRIRNKKGEALLPKLRKIITDRLGEWEKEEYKPISIAKLEEMEAKLANTGFTSFWS